MSALTPKQRRACLASKPLFLRVQLTVGSRIDLEPRAWLIVTGTTLDEGYCEIHYVLHDHRPRLLHRDSSHGYTHNPALAAVGEPEAVSKDDQDELTFWATQTSAYDRSRRRLTEERERHAKRLLRTNGRAAERIRFQISRIDAYLVREL